MSDIRTVAFTREATNVFFHILTACNLRCRHCYINPVQHGRRRVPLKTFKTWLQALVRPATKANLVLLGGEPTMHPDVVEMVTMAKAMGFASVTIDTNGWGVPELVERLGPRDVDAISFSIDGPTPEQNDRLRGRGSYEICRNGLRAAVSRGFGTSLIYTVSEANIDGLPRMAPLVEQWGVRRFFIQVIGLRGRSAGGHVQVDQRRWRAVVPEVARQIADRGITVTYPKVFLEPDEDFACAGKVADNRFIFPNGRVYRCPLCEDFPLHSQAFENDRLVATARINEADLFELTIAEGCVMNKLIQPGNITYGPDGRPRHRIACCLLKEQIGPAEG
jgi:MoaA/NifB/PqqE/SkfB family radical SAM enzyme